MMIYTDLSILHCCIFYLIIRFLDDGIGGENDTQWV
jgi:hypothetical protein